MLQLNCGLPSLIGNVAWPQVADHPLQYPLGFILAGVGEKHRELIGPQAADPIAITHRRHQIVGETAQHLVAGGMTEAVVDQLEVVQVDVAQRMRTTVGPDLQQRAFQQAFDLAAVDQAGQRIVAGVMLDLARQCMVLADILDDREHRQSTARAANRGTAPASPDEAAIAPPETQLARPQLPVPVDAADTVEDQFPLHQQVTQQHLQQHIAPVVEDIRHRLVGLDHAAIGVELQHADIGLVEGRAEAALVLGQILADATRQRHCHQADHQHRQAANHQRGDPDHGGHPQQRLRERLGLHLQAAVEIPQLLQVAIAVGHGQFTCRMPPLQLGDQGLHSLQITIGLPPQCSGFAECSQVTGVAEREHQAWNIGARVAALQETLPGLLLVRYRLFQRQPGLQIPQRNPQGLARVIQVLRIATRQIAAQRSGRILLPSRPVALAGNPGRRGRLQFLDQRGQRDQPDRHARQQRKAQSQATGHRHPPALLVRATSTHPGSPRMCCGDNLPWNRPSL